jgi:hypothetical protein
MAEVELAGSDPVCLWCGAAFRPRGAVGKRFCSDRCRAAFHRGCRLWAMQAVAEGRLPMEAIRSASKEPHTDFLEASRSPGVENSSKPSRFSSALPGQTSPV